MAPKGWKLWQGVYVPPDTDVLQVSPSKKRRKVLAQSTPTSSMIEDAPLMTSAPAEPMSSSGPKRSKSSNCQDVDVAGLAEKKTVAAALKRAGLPRAQVQARAAAGARRKAQRGWFKAASRAAWKWRPRGTVAMFLALVAVLAFSGHGGILSEVKRFMSVMNDGASEIVSGLSEVSASALNATAAAARLSRDVILTSRDMVSTALIGVDLANVTVVRRHARVLASSPSELNDWMDKFNDRDLSALMKFGFVGAGLKVSARVPKVSIRDSQLDTAGSAYWRRGTARPRHRRTVLRFRSSHF